jgi:Spy/CpxP family protein refolding chaperone
LRQEISVKLIISIMVLSLAMTAPITLLADESREFVDSMRAATLVYKTPSPMEVNKKHQGIKAVVEQLVQEGKLTREKADQIHQFIKQKERAQRNGNQQEQNTAHKEHKHGMLKELAEAKVINDAEAQVIRARLKEMKQRALDEKLGELVQQGTLTQAQGDRVKAYFENASKEKEEQIKKLQGMTEAQRKDFFKEHKKNNVINKLVEDNILTREQAQELAKALMGAHKGGCGKQ